MTNNETYTIDPRDYEQISTLTKGTYNLTSCDDGSICDLEITELVLNESINEAIILVNKAINTCKYPINNLRIP
jgi:hypothetical protein